MQQLPRRHRPLALGAGQQPGIARAAQGAGDLFLAGSQGQAVAIEPQGIDFDVAAAPAQLAAPELGAGRRFILGGGSNLVLTGDFDGLLLHMAIPGKRLRGEDGEAFYIEAGAGENWHDFVQWTLDQGWPGL